MKFTHLALLSAASLAVAQPHNHLHRHQARHGFPVEARDEAATTTTVDAAATTTTVTGPVVTVYELHGASISWAEVQDGIEHGKYVLVEESSSSVASSTSTSIRSTSTSIKPTPTPTSSSVMAAEFLEIKTTSKTSTTSTSITPPPAPTTSTVAPPPAPTTSAAPVVPTTSSPPASAPTGLDAEFPSGTIDCSTFPSAYGAVAADWLNLDGWTGIQNVPSFSAGDASISYIETAIGGGCTKNSFCSYACPPGYEKSQWPSAQGSTGQSIGGLYCNSKGKLELSRSSYKTICMKGAGGVQAKNHLSKNVAICRTDYPGTESETIALHVAGGSTVEVTCPIAANSYTWGGGATSAQYYINPAGYGVDEACKWGSAGTNLGNWAPVNMGVGKTAAGTFISLFPNAPTNPNGKLDFKIKITGGISGSCSYEDGKYYSNGAESPTGCTVGVTGTAVFEFS